MATSTFSLGRMFWPLVPTATVVIGMLISLLPFGLNGLVVTPAFALAPIFFWAVHRPGLLPALIIFVLGVGQDFASYGPVGLWGIVYLITYGLTVWQGAEISGMPMRLASITFAGIALAALLGGWFVASVYNARFLAIAPVFIQALTTALTFPLFGWILVLFEREIAATVRH